MSRFDEKCGIRVLQDNEKKLVLAICMPHAIIVSSPSPLFSCLKGLACAESLRRLMD
jgi:hypothetical protein